MIRFHRISILLGALAGSSLMGQTAPVNDVRIAALESAVKSAQLSGDNAWMLTSTALVLMMTGPGLALFYAGLVRLIIYAQTPRQIRTDEKNQQSFSL